MQSHIPDSALLLPPPHPVRCCPGDSFLVHTILTSPLPYCEKRDVIYKTGSTGRMAMHWTQPEEDQATAAGNMCRTFGEVCTCDAWDMCADRQTHKNGHHNTPNLQLIESMAFDVLNWILRMWRLWPKPTRLQNRRVRVRVRVSLSVKLRSSTGNSTWSYRSSYVTQR